MGDARAAFFQRVRDAVAARVARDRASLPEPNATTVRQRTGTSDLADVFKTRAASTGFNVHSVKRGELGERVVALLRTHDTRRAVLDPELFCRDALRRAAHDGISFVDAPVDDDPLFAADAAVTGVKGAIAESGSIVCSDSVELSLVPPVHIAIVRPEQIIPDLVDLFPYPAGEEPPPQLNIITGPSKTSDIEGILVTGVHGPGVVHVCLVEKD
jgi:L-lactate utilization protein LutC